MAEYACTRCGSTDMARLGLSRVCLDAEACHGRQCAKLRDRAEYWHKRWTAACDRADEDGAQAVIQHARILDLERQAEAADAKLAKIEALCRDDRDDPCWPHIVKGILAIAGTGQEAHDG